MMYVRCFLRFMILEYDILLEINIIYSEREIERGAKEDVFNLIDVAIIFEIYFVIDDH